MDKFGLPRLGWLHVVKQEPMTVGNPRKPRRCRRPGKATQVETKEKLIDKFWPIEKSLIEPV
ncbi:hypothetical protein T08_15585 [Trichinella sp. T8]|nr:hypothetical protein T08_15585 [Trichinella sp. T8]